MSQFKNIIISGFVVFVLVGCGGGEVFDPKATYVFYADSMEYTPFDQKLYPGEKNVLSRVSSGELHLKQTQNPGIAHFIIATMRSSLKSYIDQHGNSKKYILWTHEPRNDLSRTETVFIHGVEVQVANVYNGRIYFNNFYFLDYPGEFEHFWNGHLADKTTVDWGSKKNKAIILASYAERSDENFYLKTWIPEDLALLRTDIALRGHALGMVDVFGKGWPAGIVQANTRSNPAWKTEKHLQMASYRFAIVFENTNSKYYVTEKIWDSIYAGVLPIYYGNDWIYENFEKDSFVDYRNFQNSALMFEFLKNMSQEEWVKRINRCIKSYNYSVSIVKIKNIHTEREQLILNLFFGGRK